MCSTSGLPSLPSLSASQVGNIGSGIQLGGLFGSATGAADSVEAQASADTYQAGVAENNARIAGYAASDALYRGQVAAERSQSATAQKKGSQRARFAANGVDLSQGSALNILTDTDYIGALDANTIKDNAAREAWSDTIQQNNDSSNAAVLRARADSASPFSAFSSTLLTGAGSVASSWYRRQSGYDGTNNGTFGDGSAAGAIS